MSLDATVAGTSSNSYVTLAEADDLVGSLVTADVLCDWENATDLEKENAIKRSTIALDNLKWDGALSTATTEGDDIYVTEPDWYVWDRDEFDSTSQALQCPRHFMKDENGNALIPTRVKQACVLQAASFLNKSDEKYKKLAQAGIKRFDIDDGVEVEFDNSAISASDSKSVTREAYDLVKRYLRGPSINK